MDQIFALRMNAGTEGPYGADVQQLVAKVYFVTPDIVRIRIFDANNDRWEGEL